MPRIQAVLFDFGGTLYDYGCLAAAERESLAALAAALGLAHDTRRLVGTHRAAMQKVFADYLARSFYLHRDMFRDAVATALTDLGADPTPAALETYRVHQWDLHRRDFALREGVRETLAALRDRGLHLGMVSNIDDDQLAHLIGIAGLADAFDSVLSSEQARSCKPDGRIFAEALRRAGTPAESTLFVGDSILADVAGANAAGLQSVLLWHRADRRPPPASPEPRFTITSIPDVLTLLE